MWNGAGLYDKPTRQDGYYTTHKLALLLHVANVLNQTLPFRDELESRIWMFQRGDGGICSHYLGNMTSDREANCETAALVLLVYQYEAEQVKLKAEAEEQTRLKRIGERQNRLYMFLIILGSITGAAIITILLRKRWKKFIDFFGECRLIHITSSKQLPKFSRNNLQKNLSLDLLFIIAQHCSSYATMMLQTC
jgi:hypothetical protein